MIDSDAIRADSREFSIEEIFDTVRPLLHDLQPSLAAPTDGVLPRATPKPLLLCPNLHGHFLVELRLTSGYCTR